MRNLINTAMQIVCSYSNKKPDKILETIWSIGLSRETDESIERAIANFCKHGKSTFNIITPLEFIRFKNEYDPTGNKAAQKRIEETNELNDKEINNIPMPKNFMERIK